MNSQLVIHIIAYFRIHLQGLIKNTNAGCQNFNSLSLKYKSGVILWHSLLIY